MPTNNIVKGEPVSEQDILIQAIRKASDSGGFSTNMCGVNLVNERGEIVPEVLIFNRKFAEALWPDEPAYKLVCPKCKSEYTWWDREESERTDLWSPVYCGADGTKLMKVVDEEHINRVSLSHLQRMVVADDPIAYLEAHYAAI